jgi:hypothetical protein
VSVDGGAYGNAETETRLFIVSGGQTGADRGALDAALAAGVPCGGWCPRGRRAEDGTIPDRYPLRETPTAEYPLRTAWNVRDSDGTVILHQGRVDRGTALTERLARRQGRPVLLLDVTSARPAELVAWVEKERIARLNVAGPRESRAPGFQALVTRFLREAFVLVTDARSR